MSEITVVGPVRGAATGPRARVGLGAVAGGFLRTGTAALLVTSVVAALILRVLGGPVGWADAVVLAGVAAARPFVEWAAHRFLLHRRPRRRGRLVLDPRAARAHRAHHADPRDQRHVLTPPLVAAEFIAATGLGASLLLPRPLAATAVTGVLACALAAEWTHALVHSSHQPRSDWLRKLAWRHRLHHHRNEHYWFGITSTTADRLLGTAPDPAAVPVSPTARTVLPPAAHDWRPRPISLAMRSISRVDTRRAGGWPR